MGYYPKSGILISPARSAESSAAHDWVMYARIAGLYMVQGIPLGFGFEALPTLLRHAGVSVSSLAWTPLIGVPWMLNVFWAPLVDTRWRRSLGKRRSWIIPSQLGLAGGLLLLALIPFTPGGFWIILAATAGISLCGATQDIAVDGLAAEVFPSSALGPVNAIQVGGMALGLLLGGAGVLIGADAVGLPLSLTLLATLVLLALAPTVLWAEATAATRRIAPPARVRQFFRRPGAAPVLWLGLVATLCGTVLHGLWRLILVDAGWGPGQIGVYSALGYTGSMVVASALAAPLVKQLGERRTGVLGVLLAATAGVGWMILVSRGVGPQPVPVLLLIAASAVGVSLASVVVFAVVMRFAQAGEQPGTDFTVFQSGHVIAGGMATALAIAAAGTWGYAAGLALGVGICAAALTTFLLAGPRLLKPQAESS